VVLSRRWRTVITGIDPGTLEVTTEVARTEVARTEVEGSDGVRIAVLVKQVPRAETLELLSTGRLKRDGVELEMNSYCRRAVSKGVDLARSSGGTCTVFTLGPPSAEDCLREAIAWGADSAVLVTDPEFAGSDTLATANVLAAALKKEGPFDLVLVGRNSIDSDTGQVPPEIAELLGLPFAAGARELQVEDGTATLRCELDDGWRTVRISLPAVVSTAERLCEPAKVDPEGRASVDASRIRKLTSSDLGPGPFGQAASPTSVGDVRVMEVTRRKILLEGTLEEQVATAVSLLGEWGAFEGAGKAEREGSSQPRGTESGDPESDSVCSSSTAPGAVSGPIVAVVTESGRDRLARELLGEAAQLAHSISGQVVAIGPDDWSPDQLDSFGADRLVTISGSLTEEDVAAVLATWCRAESPWGVLVPGTLWGREVAGRCAAALGAGLTGDAVGFGIEDGRLICWKPAFGGRLVAAITASSDVQMATVRPGVLELRAPREPRGDLGTEALHAVPKRRVEVLEEGRDDDVETLLVARALVCVGAGVPPDEYDALQPLLKVLGAELAGTRKVTDKGWLPRARQVGITGHSVAPALYVALGVQGKFNHVIGTRSAGTVVAVNLDACAPIFDWADIGIVADWRQAVPALVAELESYRA
jgi:electron transfer flavoprotein alpha subunit